MDINNVLTLFERSMPSLVSVTSSTFGNDRQQDAQRVQVKNVQYVPMVEQGMLQVRANTYSESGNQYQSVIVVDNLDYINEETFNEDGGNSFEFTSPSGTTFYAQPSGNSNAQVRCTCEDFRWRFAPYNYSDKSLYGDPPEAYAKKTDRPSVNPNNTPGVCKHLIKLKNELEREDFFRSLLN